MDRQAYSKLYRKFKEPERELINDAIKHLKRYHPQRFAELQARAKYELEHPQPRTIIYASRYPSTLPFNIDELIRQFRNGRKDYYVHTIDCWNETHLYFETLSSSEDATEVMIQRHPKFTEQSEKVTKVEPCVCPLCV